MTIREWEPVQARSVDQLLSLRGYQRRPARTELARGLVSRWGWVTSQSTGQLKDGSGKLVAGCIEEVAEAMAHLNYFTTLDGDATGLDWKLVNEAQLVKELSE